MTLTLTYDPLDLGTLTDPYPLYAEMRERSPVLWHEQMRCWVLTRYRDCRDVLRDYDRFARDRRRVGEEVPEFLHSVQSLDPPAQGPLRSLMINTLRAQDFEAIGRRTQARIAETFDRVSGRAEFDWMTEVAAPISLTISADLFGVPEPDLPTYVRISDALARRMEAFVAARTGKPNRDGDPQAP